VFRNELIGRGEKYGKSKLGQVRYGLHGLGTSLELLSTEIPEDSSGRGPFEALLILFTEMAVIAERMAEKVKDEKRVAHNANMLGRYYASKQAASAPCPAVDAGDL
jgi:hypothetical protein